MNVKKIIPAKSHRDVIANRKFRAIFETSVDGLLIADDDGHYIDANPAACSLLGMPRRRVVGRSIFEFADPSRKAETQQEWKTFLKDGQRKGIFRVFRPDGATRLVDFRARAHIYPGHHLSILRDVTERNRAERSLRESEDRLRLVMDATGLGTWDFVPSTGRIKLSDFCKSILGLSSERAVDLKTFLNAIHVDDRAHMRAIMDRAMDPHGKGELSTECRCVRPDGTVRWVYAKGRAHFEGRGRAKRSSRFVGSILDITERKQIEAAMRKAKDAAESAARAKSRFVANISHEIRTPINGMMGTTNLLLRSALSPQQREYAEILRDSGAVLMDLINELLDFSKLDAGKVKLNVRDFDLCSTLDGAMEMFVERIQFKKLELILEFGPHVARHLRGAPDRLRQILVNLIGNAIKFTEKGEVVLKIESERETRKTATLRFSVRDTGPGIAKEKLNSLFRPFSQVDSSATRPYGGTGLGLTISKQLVVRMGGKIGVKSDRGRGSTFWFSIPFEKHPVKNRVPYIPQAPKKHAVLIIESNRTLRRALADQVRLCSLTPIECSTVKEALVSHKKLRAKKRQCYAVIIDQRLDGEFGLELASEFRKNPATANAKIILLGFLGDRPRKEYMDAAGITRYLSKPLGCEDLWQTLFVPAMTSELVHKHPQDPYPPTDNRAQLQDHGVKQRPASHARILVAEDNLINQFVAVRQLEELGFAVDTVTNGKEVLSALKTTQYDLILMDCQMPKMDGYEATTRIRRSGPVGSRIPIIAMTAHAMDEDREKCLQAGMNDYLSKPVQIDLMKAMVDKWLRYPGFLERRQKVRTPEFNSLKDHSASKDLLPLFIESSEKDLESLKQSVAKKSARDIKRVAHRWAGASAVLGYPSITDPLRDLERRAEKRQWAVCLTIVRKLERSLREVEHA